jgi:O-6-methylguanine DNA methyltransferase
MSVSKVSQEQRIDVIEKKDIITKIKNFKSTDFAKSVYLATIQIPKGSITTYKSIAEFIGYPNSCRAVGSALKNNPYAPDVPCHRVIASNGKIGGFFGSTDINSEMLKTKIQLLEREGIKFDKYKAIDFKKVLFTEFQQLWLIK